MVDPWSTGLPVVDPWSSGFLVVDPWSITLIQRRGGLLHPASDGGPSPIHGDDSIYTMLQ
jgi:hypothetical protein